MQYIEKLKDVKFVLLSIIAIIIFYTLVSFSLVQAGSSAQYKIDDPDLAKKLEDYTIGIVFGGGVREDGPLPLVQDRLDTAKELLDKGYIDKIILSGDNRTLAYNEPQVMFDYLLENGVEGRQLQQDNAGRSTYETCERANKIFGVTKAVLITEATHLPRASYLCGHFGIETVGVKSQGQASAQLHLSQSWREILARNKAIFNIYFISEQTVLGDPISL